MFFDGARTELGNVVGEPGDGWRIAKATLEFERGVAMLGQQVGFRREFGELVEAGAADRAREPTRCCATGSPGPGSALRSCGRTRWTRWGSPAVSRRRGLGAQGAVVALAPGARRAGDGRARRRRRWSTTTASTTSGDLDAWQRLFLFGRAETIYGGSDEIQRNIIATRALGLPRLMMPAPMKPPAGHGLLDGKVVVITAAAGTGIGSAAARRCLDEGAEVVISDQHARRLGETRDELAAAYGDRVWSLRLRRHRRGRRLGADARERPAGSGGSTSSSTTRGSAAPARSST